MSSVLNPDRVMCIIKQDTDVKQELETQNEADYEELDTSMETAEGANEATEDGTDQNGEYFEPDDIKMKLVWENTDFSVELGRKEMKIFGISPESCQQLQLRSLQERHKKEFEILEKRHKREMENEVEKRNGIKRQLEIEVREKEMYFREKEKLDAENTRLKTESSDSLELLLKKLEVANRSRKSWEEECDILRIQNEEDKRNYEGKIQELQEKVGVYEKEIKVLLNKLENLEKINENIKESLGKTLEKLEERCGKRDMLLDRFINFVKEVEAERFSDERVDETEVEMNIEPPAKRVKYVSTIHC